MLNPGYDLKMLPQPGDNHLITGIIPAVPVSGICIEVGTRNREQNMDIVYCTIYVAYATCLHTEPDPE
ncbi:hypothetical protein B0O44_108213 [Pedobacter nutrimenti]|uniref:Uncharacterized protein n=1 Tax=Pedobacter nutrimenti TaxID=1241337 RepID=A0A318U8J4_9SPHI|nr:hypothetical protein B0O44_108213 [Pedobacter nutrimenti]